MKTEYLKVDVNNPELHKIKEAAAYLQNGELVAFPTETVYGVGALVNNPAAVEKIFAAKVRPRNNPLLVHISTINQAESVVAEIPAAARILMERFWPGPVSLILPARKDVPAVITGGRNSVGLRMPSHPVALRLIDETGPLAATSANLSGRPSPVTAEHVKQDLDGRIRALLDAGATGIGIESTIIDFTTEEPKVLRKGGLRLEEIAEALDRQYVLSEFESNNITSYQTNMQVVLTKDESHLESIVRTALNEHKKIAIVHNHNFHFYNIDVHKEYEIDLKGQSTHFYSILRDAEINNIEMLIFTPFSTDIKGMNESLLDRIYRAAGINQKP